MNAGIQGLAADIFKVALVALPQIEGNPRYLQFLMAPLPVWSRAMRSPRGRGRRRPTRPAMV